MVETRSPIEDIVTALINLLETIDLGGNSMVVGDGTDPNHEPPYIVVRQVTSFNIEGPMSDPDADEDLRIAVIGVGTTRIQADAIRDKARALLTKRAFTDQLTTNGIDRICSYLALDISYPQRYDRGMAKPVFGGIDQYVIRTTPA